MAKISMQDWARLGDSLGGAYATYGENQVREGLNKGVQESQQFTPEQLKAYEEQYYASGGTNGGDAGEMTPQGLSYGVKQGAPIDYRQGDAYDSNSGMGMSPPEVTATVRPEKAAYSYGGLTQDKQFTPEQMAQQRDSQLQEYWQSSGQYGRDRMKEYGDEQTASQNRELQGIKIEEAHLKQGFNAAAQKGPEGIAAFYDEQVPDGMKSKLVRGPDGSLTVHLIPDDGSNPEGTVWKTFSGDKKLGLTPEMEFTAEIQAKMNNPDTLLEIMKLRRQQRSDEMSAANSQAQIAALNKPFVDPTTGNTYTFDVRSGSLKDRTGKVFAGDASSLVQLGSTPVKAESLDKTLGLIRMPNGRIVQAVEATEGYDAAWYNPFKSDVAPTQGGFKDVVTGEMLRPEEVQGLGVRTASGKPTPVPTAPAVNAGKITVTDPSGGVHSFSTQAAADKFKQAIGVK